MQRFLEWSRQWFVMIALLAIIGLVGLIMLETFRTDGIPAAVAQTPLPTISIIPLQMTPTPLTTVPAATATPLVRGRQHTVRTGDTLFDLAVQYGTTMEAILAENPEIIDANDLELGQLIRIPSTESP